jgi:K+-sensing histidine kinase KdpD
MLKLRSLALIAVEYIQATCLVLLATLLLFLIGHQALGQTVIALLYLLPIGWCATRWGQWPATCASVVAFLTFNFFFVPPLFTFHIAGLQGWLVLVVFLIVAVAMVGRIQAGLDRARAREREAIYLYELSTALMGRRSVDGVAQVVAGHLRQLTRAACVQVAIFQGNVLVSVPASRPVKGKADHLVPITDGPNLIGEIRIWDGENAPTPADRLLQTFAVQTALALQAASG